MGNSFIYIRKHLVGFGGGGVICKVVPYSRETKAGGVWHLQRGEGFAAKIQSGRLMP